MANASGPHDADISPAEAARRHEAGEIVLVDVREQYEWDAGHVPGSRHIELQRVGAATDEIGTDKPVAFLCLGGFRSAMVTQAFRKAGYEAYNVSGGFNAWFEQGLPTEPDDATVAPH